MEVAFVTIDLWWNITLKFAIIEDRAYHLDLLRTNGNSLHHLSDRTLDVASVWQESTGINALDDESPGSSTLPEANAIMVRCQHIHAV